MQQDFAKDLEELFALIQGKRPFAFVRFGDGEDALMRNRTRHDTDGWHSGTPASREFGQELRRVLQRSGEDFYIGTLCQSDRGNLARKQWRLLRQDLRYVTFSRLFMYGNTVRAHRYFSSEINQDVVLLAHPAAEQRPISSFRVIEFFPWRCDVISLWASHRTWLERHLDRLAAAHHGTLFLVAGGPLSNLVISRLWDRNKTNRYVDMGSVLDREIHQRPTRGAHYASHAQSRGRLVWRRG